MQALASAPTTTTATTASSAPVSTESAQATTGASAASSASPAPTQTATAPAAASGTFDGNSVNTVYGPFQVEITVSNGTITDIAMLQEGDGDRHSQQINDYAVPTLISEVLRAQSAKVSAISGASYTSAGVLQSISSAIQQAGL